MTPIRQVVWTSSTAFGVAALFLAAFFFGGLWVGASGVEYHVFGLVDGLAGILIVHVLVITGVLAPPRRGWGIVALIYAAAATAQLVALLLPPPGVLEWIVLGILVYFAWNSRIGTHRSRIVLGLGLMAVALATLKYSLLPFVWVRTQLPTTPVVNLRAIGEGLKSLVAVYVPSRPITQLFAFAALIAWVLAIWLQWPPEDPDDWLWRLPRADRDRLLYWLLSEGRGGRSISREEVRGYLERAGRTD